jgi:hypothetical protein
MQRYTCACRWHSWDAASNRASDVAAVADALMLLDRDPAVCRKMHTTQRPTQQLPQQNLPPQMTLARLLRYSLTPILADCSRSPAFSDVAVCSAVRLCRVEMEALS